MVYCGRYIVAGGDQLPKIHTLFKWQVRRCRWRSTSYLETPTSSQDFVIFPNVAERRGLISIKLCANAGASTSSICNIISVKKLLCLKALACKSISLKVFFVYRSKHETGNLIPEWFEHSPNLCFQPCPCKIFSAQKCPSLKAPISL